jgi:transcriptional regulator with XRE-family HTH domain
MAARDVPLGWQSYVRSLGVGLQRRRQEAGLTQEQLAHAAGVTRSHYQQLEKGLSRAGVPANPSLLTLVALSAALGIEVVDLLGDLAPADIVTGRRSA